jgi:hypothetical protein
MREAALLPDNVLSHSSSSMRHPPREFDLAVIVTQSTFVQMMAFTSAMMHDSRRASVITTSIRLS